MYTIQTPSCFLWVLDHRCVSIAVNTLLRNTATKKNYALPPVKICLPMLNISAPFILLSHR